VQLIGLIIVYHLLNSVTF